GAPAAQAWPLAAPLLSDASRGVRLRAVALLAAVPTASQPPADRDRFERAATELVAAETLNADRPEARSALGTFYARRGRGAEAVAALNENLRRHPADRATLLALISFSRGAGELAAALAYAEQLARIVPGDPGLDALIASLRDRIAKPAPQ